MLERSGASCAVVAPTLESSGLGIKSDKPIMMNHAMFGLSIGSTSWPTRQSESEREAAAATGRGNIDDNLLDLSANNGKCVSRFRIHLAGVCASAQLPIAIWRAGKSLHQRNSMYVYNKTCVEENQIHFVISRDCYCVLFHSVHFYFYFISIHFTQFHSISSYQFNRRRNFSRRSLTGFTIALFP